MKREYDGSENGEDYGNDEKKLRRTKRDDDRYELRILLPNRAAGAIIGRKGEIIKQLRKQFDAKISVPDSTSPERALTISANVKDVVDCVNDIIPRIDENCSNKHRNGSEIRLLVHESLAGAIIGRGGSNIKDLRQSTETQIKVFGECAPYSSDRVVVIGGLREKIVGCVDKIIGMIREIPIKGSVRLYEAMCYEARRIELYGGYPPENEHPRLRGAESRYSPRYSDSGSRHYSRNSYREPMERPFPLFNDYVETTQVTVPNELGGIIIGQGGSRIRRVREESGARVVVEADRGYSDRIITISGTPGQIQTAQVLLQECIASSRFKKKYR